VGSADASALGGLCLRMTEIERNFLLSLLWEDDMTAFNIVRFRVKPGHQEQFIAQHRGIKNPGLKGFRGGSLVKTGENTFCFIGEWASFQRIVDARPLMIGILDVFREHLEDQGGGLGLTDPVSGEVVLKLPATKPAVKKGRAKKTTKRQKRR
jgi:hypothetical protein